MVAKTYVNIIPIIRTIFPKINISHQNLSSMIQSARSSCKYKLVNPLLGPRWSEEFRRDNVSFYLSFNFEGNNFDMA